MKGFKPTGYGPSPGFVFSAKQGFTGSTGAWTNVQPYIRRKAFADGGFVRQDNPRMKEEMSGDTGSALVRRSKPYTSEDQESGGKSPLRRGFKKGGKVPGPPSMKKNMNPMKAKGPPSDAMKRSPRVMKKADGGMVGSGAFTQLSRMRKRATPKPPSASITKEKFAADGGRIVRGSSARPFMESLADVPALIKEVMRHGVPSSGMVKQGADRVSGRQRQIDSEVDAAVNGKTTASNYARGGKAKMKRGMMPKC